MNEDARPDRPRKPRPSKHDDRVKIKATPEQVARSLFGGKPKSRGQWRYLKENERHSA